jgi:FG-GAP repeat
MNSAKILLTAGLLAAGAGMVSPSAAGAMAHPAQPSAGPAVALLATLHDPLPSEQDSFGQSVAVSGNTAVVGAPGPGGAAVGAGKVYIYTKGSTGWPTQPTATLTDPASPQTANFGVSVAVSGNTVIVGAINPDVDVNANHGVVFVYTKGAAGWPTAPTVTLADPAPSNLDFFGLAVAIAGGTIVVGAPDRAGDGPDPSAAYIYTEGAAGWPTAPTVTLPVPATAQDDLFGSSTAVSGNTVVIGAPGSVGKTYLYTKGTAGWPTTPSVKFASPRAPKGTGFGTSVAVAGKTLAIGAHLHGTAGEGPVYLYTETAAGWPTSPTVKLRDPKPGPYDGFGDAVTVSGGTTVLGAFNAAPRSGVLSPGRAYVYGRTTAGWPTTPTVTLHPGAAVYFGYSVAAQGTTALISAGDVVYVYRI